MKLDEIRHKFSKPETTKRLLARTAKTNNQVKTKVGEEYSIIVRWEISEVEVDTVMEIFDSTKVYRIDVNDLKSIRDIMEMPLTSGRTIYETCDKFIGDGKSYVYSFAFYNSKTFVEGPLSESLIIKRFQKRYFT